MGIQTTSVGTAVFSFLGLTCLSFLYGLYGLLLTVLQFFRLGRKNFFKHVDHPSPPAKALDPFYGTHEMIKLKSSGISLHYVSKGVPNQPMILFLHGFPECWYSWRNQMKYFSKDYRVVAIDQRGYGLSSKSPFAYDYRVETLAGDVADVIEQLGYESCILVGHDIGGMVAWVTAMLYPHLIEKLIILNCPHPLAFHQDISLSQVHRSWYMFFSQLPYIPEMSLKANDFSILKHIFHGKPLGLLNKENLTDEDIDVYKYTLSQPRTLTAVFHFYRGLLRYQSDYSRCEITAPVLLLWGCQDPMLCEELADASKNYCGDIRVKKIRNSSHWINQDVPDIVNKHIEIFLNENPEMEHNYDF